MEANQTQRNVIFPSGAWINFFDGTRYEEGTYSVTANAYEIPVFAKAGSIIPLTTQIYNTSDYTSDSLHIVYFPDESVEESSFTLFADNGSSTTSLQNNEFQTITITGHFDTTDIILDFLTAGIYVEAPVKRDIVVEIRRISGYPETVKFDDTELIAAGSFSETAEFAPSWFYDESEDVLYAHVELRGTSHELQFLNVTGTEAPPQISVDDFAIHTVSPNPFTNYIDITYDVISGGDYMINVFSIDGKSVYSADFGKLARGRYYRRIETENLASGIYVVELSSNQSRKQSKIVKL